MNSAIFSPARNILFQDIISYSFWFTTVGANASGFISKSLYTFIVLFRAYIDVALAPPLYHFFAAIKWLIHISFTALIFTGGSWCKLNECSYRWLPFILCFLDSEQADRERLHSSILTGIISSIYRIYSQHAATTNDFHDWAAYWWESFEHISYSNSILAEWCHFQALSSPMPSLHLIFPRWILTRETRLPYIASRYIFSLNRLQNYEAFSPHIALPLRHDLRPLLPASSSFSRFIYYLSATPTAIK